MIVKLVLLILLAVAAIAAVLTFQSRDEIARYREISRM
jgi:hypothetical protein